MKILFILIIVLLNLNASFKASKIISNLGVVWGMTFLDEERLLISQKDGRISLINSKRNTILDIQNTPKVLYKGQAGLLDIQNKNAFIYMTYVKNIKGYGVTTLARAKLDKNSLVNFEELLVSKSLTSTTAHFGSRITFDNKGHLFFSIGDRGVRKNGQDLQTHAGSILRLNMNGSIPKDNPFINNVKALDEIYSYGHRNPQGIFFDKEKNKLYSIEHGPRGGDEINLITKGSNYGWPIISYGKEYSSFKAVGESTHKEGMKQPLKVYIPSIAPSSLIVYSGKLYKEYKGDIFSGALKLRHLNIIKIDKNDKVLNETRVLKNLQERIRNVIESPSGEIYISTDSGSIYKLYMDK